MAGLSETFENKIVKLLTNAYKLPNWGIHPFDTYNKFSKFSGIFINHPRDLYFINEELLDKFSENLIYSYCKKIAAIGFALGIPGGPISYPSLIGDIEEYLRATFNLSQEMMYIYGVIPHPLTEKIEADQNLFFESIREETLKAMAIAFGASSISIISKEISKKIAEKEAKEILNKKVSEKVITQLAKKIAKLLGIKLTKKSISKFVLRVIPVIGGVTSGIINYKSFQEIGDNLRNGIKKEREEIRKILDNKERKNIIVQSEYKLNENNLNNESSHK